MCLAGALFWDPATQHCNFLTDDERGELTKEILGDLDLQVEVFLQLELERNLAKLVHDRDAKLKVVATANAADAADDSQHERPGMDFLEDSDMEEYDSDFENAWGRDADAAERPLMATQREIKAEYAVEQRALETAQRKQNRDLTAAVRLELNMYKDLRLRGKWGRSPLLWRMEAESHQVPLVRQAGAQGFGGVWQPGSSREDLLKCREGVQQAAVCYEASNSEEDGLSDA
jgi:hypothetical protein